jgi:hypothetical protein
LQRVQKKCCPKLYPRKRLQRLATKKSVAIYTIATILDILQHFSGVETASKISSARLLTCASLSGKVGRANFKEEVIYMM